MPITRFDQLAGVADGELVEVVGRYEPWTPDLRPPGERPLTARVVLADGVGVLVGRYRDVESRRPDEELDRLAGALVRVSGSFSKGREFPGPGPMPGLWTGGGPQIVAVAAVELVEPAIVISQPPVVSAPPITRLEPPAMPSPGPPPVILPPPARSAARLHAGTIARRSLAGGRSRVVIAGPIAALVATCAGALLVLHGLHVAPSQRYQISLVVVGGGLAFFATEWLAVRWLAARELRWLAALRWPFDAGSYVAQLECERVTSTLRIDVELAAPIPEAARASLVDHRRLRLATVSWPHAHVLSIRCPTVLTETSGRWMTWARHDNASVHRWFRRCALAALEPLAAAGGIRAVVAQID